MNKTNKTTFENLLQTPIGNEKDYFRYVRALYDEWNGRMRDGYPTQRKMGKYIAGLRVDMPPQFFAGDIRSPFVIISLNPHADADGRSTEIDAAKHCQSWEDYRDFWKKFPKHRYAKGGKARSAGGKLSRFDCKLQKFLSGNTAEVTSGDLSRWNMFHVELFPIASPSFDAKSTDENFFPYVLRMLEVIALYPRTLVLVLNGNLEKILMCMKRVGKIMFEKNSPIPFAIQGRTTRAYRKDYAVTLAKGTVVRIVAATTFAMKGFDGEHLVSYNQQCFTEEERITIKRAIRK